MYLCHNFLDPTMCFSFENGFPCSPSFAWFQLIMNSSDGTVPQLMPLHIPSNLPPCVPITADANNHSLV